MGIFSGRNKNPNRHGAGSSKGGQFAPDTRGATAPGTGGPSSGATPSSVPARNGAAASTAPQPTPAPDINHALQRFSKHPKPATPKPKTAAAPAAPPDSPYPPKPGNPGNPGNPGDNKHTADSNRKNSNSTVPSEQSTPNPDPPADTKPRRFERLTDADADRIARADHYDYLMNITKREQRNKSNPGYRH